MATRVVHVRDPYDVYIGRANGRYRLARSVWANPFAIGSACTRDQAIERYAQWIEQHPELLARIGELRGRVLGCWCRPREGFRGRLLCHGQILAALADGTRPEESG